MLNEERTVDGVLYVYDKVIPVGALQGRMVKELVLVNAVSIEDDAIYRCPYLEKMSAPCLENIGLNVVEDCPKLKEVDAKLLNEKGIVYLGSLFVDLNKKEILNCGNFSLQLVRVMNEELQKASSVQLVEKNDGIRVLKIDDNEFLKEEKGQIVGICLPTALKLPAHALYENQTVRNLVLLSAVEIDHNAVYKAVALERVFAPNVKKVRFSNFSKCPKLVEAQLPELFMLQEGCFCSNDLLADFPYDKLESVDRGCFCYLPSAKVLCLKKAMAIGESSIQNNPNMKAVLLPSLSDLERGVLYKTGVETLYAPLIGNRAQSIKYLKNAKQLIRRKEILPDLYRQFVRE